ncbi:hypothetical protein RYX45_20465, partial [Alkalihalophilus pseudofirmus]
VQFLEKKKKIVDRILETLSRRPLGFRAPYRRGPGGGVTILVFTKKMAFKWFKQLILSTQLTMHTKCLRNCLNGILIMFMSIGCIKMVKQC